MRRATKSLSKKLSALLASSSASGSIAATRNLGLNGIDVSVISSRALSAAAWSRWAVRSYSAPSETESDLFLKRLIEIGRASPGQILLPTSDETAWLYTVNADVLRQCFRVYQPSLATIQTILDKSLFEAAATRAGLGVLPSWYPRGLKDLETLSPTLPYPILIKPRTHVHRLRNDKGIVVRSPAELDRQYAQFIDRERAHAANTPLMPDANLPILQRFVDVGREGVLSVTGFIDRTGQYFVTRLSKKVLLRSLPVGVGVCFESLPAATELSDSVRRLCQHIGYFGIFEVEFLWFNDTWVAIDFNPRMFNQLGMDIRRGMPLPLLACLDAAGETSTLKAAVAKAQKEDENASTVYRDRFTLHAMLLAQTLTARISRQDRLYWHSWARRNAAHAVDAAIDRTDPLPGVIHALTEIYQGLRAFPRFLRLTPRVAIASMSSDPGTAAS